MGTVTKDNCDILISYEKQDEKDQEFNVDVTFKKVTADEKIIEKAGKIEDSLFGTFHVADIDMINHLINYESDTSTFFSNKRAGKEFSKLKM